MSMDQLDQFLGELRQAGQSDSSGEFTLSRETAQDKLEKFQLPYSSLYIVQMVAAAVASGATFLKIETRLSKLEFISDGLAPSKEELEHIYDFLYPAVDRPEYLSELAVGLQAALSLPSKSVLIEAFHEEEAWQLELQGDRQRFRPLDPISPITPLLRVVVDKGFGLRTRLTQRHPERHNLVSCRHVPIALTLDGEDYKSQYQLEPPGVLAWASIRRGNQYADLKSESPPSLNFSDDDFYGWLAVVPATTAQGEGLIWVHHGVSIKRPVTTLNCPNVCGVIYTRGLRRNISFTDLAENKRYQQQISRLQGMAIDLLAELCREPEKTRSSWFLLTGPISQLTAKESLTHRMVFENWKAFVEASHASGPADHFETLRKARIASEQGYKKDASALRQEVVRKLVKDILIQFGKGSWDGIEPLLRPLEQALRDDESPALPRFRQGLNVMHCLQFAAPVNPSVFKDSCRWGIHRRALIERAAGNLVGAAEIHASALDHDPGELTGWAYRFCAEVELAKANYQEADELLGKAEEHFDFCRDLYEERAFLKRLVSAGGKAASVRYLEVALEGTQKAPFVHWIFLDWLVTEGRGILPLEQWIKLRAKASFEEMKSKITLGTRGAIESRLKQEFDLLGWKSLDEARAERVKASQMAESDFGFTHPYTQFTRRRAIYQLHRLEAHEMAEKLQCRGHLLSQFEHCIKGLVEED